MAIPKLVLEALLCGKSKEIELLVNLRACDSMRIKSALDEHAEEIDRILVDSISRRGEELIVWSGISQGGYAYDGTWEVEICHDRFREILGFSREEGPDRAMIRSIIGWIECQYQGVLYLEDYWMLPEDFDVIYLEDYWMLPEDFDVNQDTFRKVHICVLDFIA